MRPLRFPIAGSALICAALSSSPARAPAQTTLTVPTPPTWIGRPDTDLVANVVNLRDCTTPDVLVDFNVTVGTVADGHVLQVWSGSDCATKSNRDQNNSCVKVFESNAVSSHAQIRVKDMLQPSGNAALGIGTGNDDTCLNTGGSTVATKRLLWFLVLDPASLTAALAQASWEFSFDMSPPKAPEGATAGPGEESLVVTFDAPSETDLSKYRVYCTPDAGDCTSATLIAGEDPPAGLADCGSTNSKAATSVTAKGLTNGTSYAVAVASEDLVGNTSKLSNVTCGVPQEVTGFYEAYRAAGGEAGGGFFACSFSPARSGAYGALGALALAAAALWRRRR